MPATHTSASVGPVGLLSASGGTVTWPGPVKALLDLVRNRDTEFGGPGRVSGTVLVKGTPNFPKYARTRLIDERTGICFREVWSDPTTGAYSFEGVSMARKYTVVAYDHLHNFRAVIADNLTPSLIT